MQLLNSPIINDHYLIIHTFSGATAHSSCVAIRVERTSWCSCSPDRFLPCSFFWTDNKQLQSHKVSDDWQSQEETTMLTYCMGFQAHHTSPTSEPTCWPSDWNKLSDLVEFCVTKGFTKNFTIAKSCFDLLSDHSPVIVTLTTKCKTKRNSHT
jgi:hypothetical protein